MVKQRVDLTSKQLNIVTLIELGTMVTTRARAGNMIAVASNLWKDLEGNTAPIKLLDYICIEDRKLPPNGVQAMEQARA